MIEDLKVLKDIQLTNDPYLITGRQDMEVSVKKVLESEAQKWIVYLTKETADMFQRNYFQKNYPILQNEAKIEWIKQFFNIQDGETK